MMHITICVITFERPKRLQRLLDGIDNLSIPVDAIVDVVIVDNDAHASARQVVESRKSDSTPVRYAIEPVQNIAHARNRAMKLAEGEWIAFIDDDEVPDKDWLAAYAEVLKQYPEADGFFGPVIPELEGEAPGWLDKDKLLGRPRMPTGTALRDKMRTGNAFLRKAAIPENSFDPEFGLMGGSDAVLFANLAEDGCRFYWCDEALTHEYYPASRTRLKWLLQRSFRGGMAWSYHQFSLHPGYYRLYTLFKAFAGLLAFTLAMPIDILRGSTAIVKRLMRIAVQAGHIWAVFNLKYFEYGKPAAQRAHAA